MTQILNRLVRKPKPLSYSQMTANLNAISLQQRADDNVRRQQEAQAWEQRLVERGIIAEHERVA
jgi:hypothetical protein